MFYFFLLQIEQKKLKRRRNGAWSSARELRVMNRFSNFSRPEKKSTKFIDFLLNMWIQLRSLRFQNSWIRSGEWHCGLIYFRGCWQFDLIFLIVSFRLCGCKLKVNIIVNEIFPSHLVYQTNFIMKDPQELKWNLFLDNKVFLSFQLGFWVFVVVVVGGFYCAVGKKRFLVAIFCNWIFQFRKWTIWDMKCLMVLFTINANCSLIAMAIFNSEWSFIACEMDAEILLIPTLSYNRKEDIDNGFRTI